MANLDALSSDDVNRLIAAATAVEYRGPELAARRRKMVQALAELLEADAAHWAWGRGNPLTSEITPVAIIDHGYSPAQLTTLIDHGLKPESIAAFQSQIMPLMNGRRSAGVVRGDVISDQDWQTPHWRDYVARLGLDSWVHAIHYRTGDTWSCLHFLRRLGRAEFTAREAALAELALTGVAWLNAAAEEQLPPETFVQLTPRQRTAMLLLLDGKSRKDIASELGISEYTVDDHLRAIYAHFGVRSVGELAAKFLKMA